ncbi:MAG: hypothetical protein D8M58_04555 [Calditrichaeota bacterium]|nr:MAG: hypothetical protein DWQ03_02520 [Calditrichota bacterium]MBL1204642.1 hypothetical protein [Calditrichota bacterium]NOG44470.1 hypothetical protein [Calditrichota bacterium]
MFQEIATFIFVLLAVGFSIRSLYKQFSSTEDAGCTSCPDCTIPASDSMHSSYFKEKRQRDIKYTKIK